MIIFFFLTHSNLLRLQDGNNGDELGITEQLQELIEKRDVSVELGGATVTLSPRNLEENELGLTLRLPSSAEPRSEYTTVVYDRYIIRDYFLFVTLSYSRRAHPSRSRQTP